MNSISISPPWRRIGRSVAALLRDRSGIAATEFAVIVPIMLVMFFGTVELSSGVAVDRKVTLMARTLSDLTSQSTSVADSDMTNFFAAAGAIMTPYAVAPTQPIISEIYIDAAGKAWIQWSKAATVALVNGSPVATLVASTHNPGDQIMTVPSALAIPQSYLIWSQVSYLYVPTIGYVMSKTGVSLSDTAYTRPRQSQCVNYGASPPTTCTPIT
jgi:Flp pilus assembly protein TadG